MDYYWICFATPPIQFTPKKVKGYCAITTFTGMEISPVTRCVFWSFFSQRPSRMKPPKLCPWENLAPLLLILSQNSVSNFFLGHPVYNFLTFPYQKNMYLLAMHTIFWNEYKVAKKNPKISHDSWSSGIDFVSAPKETMIELVQVLLSQVDRRPCWAKLIKMSGMLSLEADKQCPAGTRTWPATQCFFRYPT